jgi:N-acetylmuramoyl-L-alanine amidase
MKNAASKIILFLCLVQKCMPAQAVNILNKVELHKKSGPEMGILSLYFSEKPKFTKVIQKTNTARDLLTFSFPLVKKENQVNQAIALLNQDKNQPYTIAIDQGDAGINISIIFDSNLVAVNVYDFNSIKKQKGINIAFINKLLLKEIEEKSRKAVLTTACNKAPSTIVIDCGHGGKDPGALGYLNKAEKEVTLNVGTQVAHLLNKKGFKVAMTRKSDIDMALGKRTTFANFIPADLFISIHANSSLDKTSSGIETYSLSYELFNQSFSTLDKNGKLYIAQLEKDRCAKSNKFAHCVHTKTIETVAQKKKAVDRSVRKDVTQVLFGTDMPAALIEIGFISNEQEALLIYDKDYQHLLAQGICNGIISYINSIKAV